jgi:hypothetical protein
MTKNEILNSNTIKSTRVSVFDRLGPKPTQNAPKTQSRTPIDEEFEIPARRVDNIRQDHHRHGDGKRRERSRNAERDAPAASNQPGLSGGSNIFSKSSRQIKPNALLHKTLQDVKKERITEAFAANPSAAIIDLEQRLHRAEDDRIAAEELSNALLLTQQTLLQEKTKLEAENMKLHRELEQLKERLAFLDIGGDGGLSAGHRDGEYGEYAEEHIDDTYDIVNDPHYQAITPDSGMLKAIQLNSLGILLAKGDDLFEDVYEDDLISSRVEDVGNIAKKLEEEI